MVVRTRWVKVVGSDSGYLANVTSLEHERWERAHPEFCRRMGIK